MKIRVVLDTSNPIKALLAPAGASGAILDACREGRCDRVCSESILEEWVGVLRRPHIQRRYHGPSEETVRSYLDLIRRIAVMASGRLVLKGVSADPKDDHILACAVEGEAQYLVSADKAHLLSLGTYEGIRLIAAPEFLAALRLLSPDASG